MYINKININRSGGSEEQISDVETHPAINFTFITLFIIIIRI